jgi:hypothetical protein
MNERAPMVWERLPVAVRVAVTLFYAFVAVLFLAAMTGTNQRKQIDMPAVTRSLAMLASRSWAA